MRLRSTPHTSPEHWSRDFVEHLRTVHFALVSVSVGLILLLTSKPYDAKEAASQMAKVVLLNESIRKPELGMVLDMLLSNDHGVAFDSSLFSAKSLRTNEVFTFRIPHPNLFLCDSIHSESSENASPESTLSESKFSKYAYAHLDSSVLPNTLRGFLLWYEKLRSQKIVVIDSALRINPRSVYRDMNAGLKDEFTIELLPQVPRVHKGEPIELTFDDRCDPDSDPRDEPIQLSGNGGSLYFEFDVVVGRRGILSVPVTTVPFSEAFPDLEKASAGKKDLALDVLASQLNADAAKGDESFEAFGVKFSSEQVTRWGIVILIGVQLYLVMYLRRLSDKLEPNDPGWDVPWMAMDQSLLARGLLFISIVVLPVCAALLITVQARGQVVFEKWRWHFSSVTIQFVLAIIGLCLSILLSFLSWKFRPKLREPIAPAQLFE